MADEPLIVCLLGPSNIGKSQLLTAMVKAAEGSLYGYQSNFNLHVEPVSKEVREAAREGRLPALIQAARQTEYDERVADAEAGVLTATISSKIQPYEFSVSYRAAAAVDAAQTSKTITDTMMVYDSAGGHVFLLRQDNADESGDDEHASKELSERVSQSTGLVIVLPFYGLGTPYIRKGMDHIVKYLTQLDQYARSREMNDWPPLQNIAIAMHQYERLFMNCGAEAVELAMRPETARRAISRAVSGLNWFRRLRTLDTDSGPFKICLVPTSAYGFLPGFGNPNIDPRSAAGNLSFREHSGHPGGQDSGDQEYYPFLAADPFVFAATGAWTRNDYLFRARDIDAPAADAKAVVQRPPEPMVQPAPFEVNAASEEPAEATPWVRLRDWLDRFLN